ncbi:LuxR C-terminal-related transcriptional regulator [Saccharopolyspora sp. NPDC050389]|uniref:helix-turn-helix transcriptional regulator n=1 Tax=Saccharopolyspora sp. NPDC050389 TaxID=3155516 RepID=UPI0034020F90
MTGHAEPIGRQRELAELDRLLAAAPGFAAVAGPAGIGKTAVVEHFLSRHPQIRVARAVGLPWEQSDAFAVLDQLLRGSDAPRDAAGLLAWCSAGPGIVVVDDAQWADVESLEALLSAFRRLTSEPVLIVLVARELPAAVRPGATVRIGPLMAAEVRTLAMLHAGRDLSAPTAHQLATHTGGNPRHIRDLLDELPPETWSRWHPALPAPRAVAADVTRRLYSCSAATREFIEAAAVLGRTVPVAAAAELADIKDPIAALDAACESGLVGTVAGHGLMTLAFPDPLVHAAIYHDVPPLVRYGLHGTAAQLAEDEHAKLKHLVAQTPAPDPALADELDDFAARQAGLGAWSVAGQALIDASRLSPAKADREHRLVRAVDALVGAGDLAQASAFSAQIESFPPGPLRDAVLGYLAIQRGRPAEAELLLTRAWEACRPGREPETAALICQRRVLHSLSRWHGTDLVAWGRRAVTLADPQDPSAVESEAIMGLGLAATGRIREAQDTYRDVVARVSRGAQSQRVQMGKGWLDLALDDPQTARRELEIAVPTEYRMGALRISLWAQAWLARADFALGSWDEALQTVDRAAVQLAETGLELVRPLVHWTGAQIHALRGDPDAAQHHLRQASASTHNYEIMLIPACLARAHCAEAQSDYEGVLRALEPVAQLWPREGVDEPGFWPWPDIYGNALVMTNRVAEADEFLRPHEALAAERGHRSATARLGYVRGRILAATGDVDAARESFEAALANLRTLPLPYERTRVHFAYGQTLRRAGKRKEADVVLQRARDGYAALGATAYVVRCDRELKAGGLHPKRGGVDLTELTPQEQAVAKLVAAGMTNKQVAAELFVSVKTVQFHLTRIYAKLGIRSRSELAARGHASAADG